MRRITARIADQGPFTDKEAQVLRLMCEGLYGPEIALRLFRSPRTIDKHRENIAQKLNARGSSEIVLIARELGFIEITLTDSSNLLKTLVLLIICTTLFPKDDMRNDMRRPHRERTHAVRAIRLLHRQQ
ncbi:MAG: LuxR C-terminal-related transcriptional regulator [Methylobacter sp.]